MNNFKEITSLDNIKIKQLRKLQRKKYREKLNLFCVENLIIIHDALQAGFVPEYFFLTETILKQKQSKLKFILGNIDRYYQINDVINKTFSSLETPSGLCAVYNKPQEMKLDSGKLLYLNAIKNPGNLGTILRTALAFGFIHVIVDEYCVDFYNPKTISSAKDSIFKLNIVKDKNYEVLNHLRESYKIFATNVQSGLDVSKLIIKEKYCVVLGNEVDGVDANIMKIAHEKIHIKMPGNIESLNVATAAGIILYELINSD